MARRLSDIERLDIMLRIDALAEELAFPKAGRTVAEVLTEIDVLHTRLKEDAPSTGN